MKDEKQISATAPAARFLLQQRSSGLTGSAPPQHTGLTRGIHFLNTHPCNTAAFKNHKCKCSSQHTHQYQLLPSLMSTQLGLKQDKHRSAVVLQFPSIRHQAAYQVIFSPWLSNIQTKQDRDSANRRLGGDGSRLSSPACHLRWAEAKPRGQAEITQAQNVTFSKLPPKPGFSLY